MSSDFWADLLGLIGTLALVLPALRVNRLAKALSRVQKVTFSSDDAAFLHDLKQDVEEDLNKRVQSWNRLDERMLIGGLVLIVLSFLVKVVT